MYRQYENPRELEEHKRKLEKKKEELCADMDRYEKQGNSDMASNIFDALIDLENDINELSDRINFAYQDEEYEDDYRRYGD